MNSDLSRFLEILRDEDRFEALRFIIDLKESKGLSVMEIFEILTYSLNNMQQNEDENIDIWKEHVRTAIIKTIVENLYPFVIEERNTVNTPRKKTVAVICPPEEYHDLGARMVSDILTINGYKSIFVGGNTPLRVYEAGLEHEKIDYVAISISNPYHLFSARRITESLRKTFPAVKIIIGGSAISKLGDELETLKADFISNSLDDLSNLEGAIL
jgi:methanogenic corrinoid protein MtbC1